jgi:hypothetical protein
LYDWTRDPGEFSDLIPTPEGKSYALGLRLEMEGLAEESSKKK